jgi:hypothetical protein
MIGKLRQQCRRCERMFTRTSKKEQLCLTCLKEALDKRNNKIRKLRKIMRIKK